MKITILAVGKIKEAYFRDAIKEYEKRLSSYCKFEMIEVADEKTPDHASEALETQIKEKEALRLLKYIKEDAYVVSLVVEGKQKSSEEFSAKIESLGIYGTSHIQFVIGGSLGLHSLITQRAAEQISFSAMTFPHQLMRVILCEQIYRAYKIMQKEPYHK